MLLVGRTGVGKSHIAQALGHRACRAGYHALYTSAHEMLIRQRYQHGATIITSNRDVEEWHPLFDDALLASAAMDQLLHNAHVVTMDGDTYCNPPPAKRARRGNGRAAAG